MLLNIKGELQRSLIPVHEVYKVIFSIAGLIIFSVEFRASSRFLKVSILIGGP